ncbi:MAG: hypothetical protein GDA67_16460 [Nitrospira sp. CR1.3]|nr:hypothetical protein [Nitrospira sp. CR1.3]
MLSSVEHFLTFLRKRDGINDKAQLAKLATKAFSLTKDRVVYYCDNFAVRFSAAASQNFGNTVLSLSNLQKFDTRPFIVCLVTPTYNFTFLANTTFLKKISHSSQQLRENNIRGSFNGTDIMRAFEGIPNTPQNIERLFSIHSGIGFEGNLARLVEATNKISPSGKKFVPNTIQRRQILAAPKRAIRFVKSQDAQTLKAELDAKVRRFRNEILVAALIENANFRGRVIEYLIAGENDRLRGEIINSLANQTRGLPTFKTDNYLGDYTKVFEKYDTETDVKTKIMIRDSNPKAYNLDKMLEFLSSDRSIFMFYFVGIGPGKTINTILVSMFQNRLLRGTLLLKHWAGRNSRGVSQLEGKAIGELILSPDDDITESESVNFLERVLAL